jgi:SAM-dependent methyltransferase
VRRGNPPSTAVAPPPRGRLGGWPRRLRRLAARFALVEEARSGWDRSLVDFDRERLQPLVERLGGIERELERVRHENAALLRLAAGPDPAIGANEPLPRPPGRSALFTEIERGSRAEVAGHAAGYVACFEGLGPVVDLGCGRGEFLSVATQHGISAYGVDSDPVAVDACRALGLDARREDLFSHLAGLAGDSVGGVFCSQVVEHLPPDMIPGLMRDVARVVRPGGVAVVETPNPASFATHVHSFWRDPTHTRPVPEPALSFAARTAGLIVDEVRWLSVPPDPERLPSVPLSPEDGEVRPLAEAFNSMVDRLNLLLYGPQDYALILRKPVETS